MVCNFIAIIWKHLFLLLLEFKFGYEDSMHLTKLWLKGMQSVFNFSYPRTQTWYSLLPMNFSKWRRDSVCIWWPFILAVGSVNSWRLSIMDTPPICLGSRYSCSIGTGVVLKVVLLQRLTALKHQLIIYGCSELNILIVILGLLWPASFSMMGMGEFLGVTNMFNCLPEITWLPTCYH